MKRGKMRFGYLFVRTVVRIIAHVLVGVRVEGAERVPRTGKVLLVANHISNLDPPVLGVEIPREIHFAAKQELFKGAMGYFFRYMNCIPVRRQGSDKESIKAMVQRLREGNAVLIFPEGTRTLDPSGGPAKAGVGMLARMAEADLLPIRVDGSHKATFNPFRRTPITIRFGDVIRLEDVLDEAPSRKEAYRVIADRVMERIRAMGLEAEAVVPGTNSGAAQ